MFLWACIDPSDDLWVVAEGADGSKYSYCVPLTKAVDDCMVAYLQNGEPLRQEQGFPARLFVPGFGANHSVKWLRRLKLGTEPFMTRWETSKYTDPRPDHTADMFTFAQQAKSIITTGSSSRVRCSRIPPTTTVSP